MDVTLSFWVFLKSGWPADASLPYVLAFNARSNFERLNLKRYIGRIFFKHRLGRICWIVSKYSKRHSLQVLMAISFDSFLIIVLTFKYLGTTLTNENDIHDEIESRLNLGNACYYSVQNLLPYCLILRNLKIKIYKTVILPVVL